LDSKKYQVFVSSTYKDLEEERESIIKAILEMYHIPIGMEMFSAEDEDQWEIIRRTIDVSDYYVLILGLRYGSKTSDGISFTQKEYEYALEKKIPILAFVMSDNVSLPKSRRDDDLSDINAFRHTVLDNSKMAQFWETKDELIKSVSISLMKQIMQKPGVGWVRGDKLGVEEDLSKELTSLSKENRALRESIIELESKISPKIPKIEVNVAYPSVSQYYHDLEPKILPSKLSLVDIPSHLTEYLDDADVDTFNNSFPSESELMEYNITNNRYHKLTSYSTPLVIKVSNIGTCKAQNVYVEMVFPDTVAVYDQSESFVEPENPIPKNPLVEAELQYEQEFASLATIQTVMQRMNYFNNILEDYSYAPHVGSLSHLRTINRSWWTRLDGNKVTIKIDNLLHTRTMTFGDEYLIAPLALVSGEVKVNIICEEYDQEDVKVIDLHIEQPEL
jgi:hypothetical protein